MSPRPEGKWHGNYGQFDTKDQARRSIEREIKSHLANHNYDAPLIGPDGSLWEIVIYVSLQPWPKDE